MLKCSKCNKNKENTFFRKRNNSKSGFNYWCRECENTTQRGRYIKKVKKKSSDEDVLLIKQKAFERMLRHRYNIDIKKYNELLEEQNNSCKICNTPIIKGNNLVIDHCHNTLKVRGLLCRRCNTFLGYIEKSPNILNNSIKYLKESLVD